MAPRPRPSPRIQPLPAEHRRNRIHRGPHHHQKSLANLSTYEHRLTRILENAKKELAELQKARRDRDASELDTAINIRRYSVIHKLEWEPADNGFVFTNTELDAHLRRNTRRDKANNYAFCHNLAYTD